MLTISLLLDALTNKQKMNISQNKLAKSFNTSASTVNAWLKKNAQPQMDANAFYDGINTCHKKWISYKNDSEYVESIINFLEITPFEKDILKTRFNLFKNKYPSDDDNSAQEFLMHLIQLALRQEEIRISLQYEVNNPAQPIIGIGGEHVIAVVDDGHVLSTGANNFKQCDICSWSEIVSVSAGWRNSVGLKSDGTCIVTGHDSVNNNEYDHWNNLKAVCCGPRHFLGLKIDGTVVAHGINGDGQCNVSKWRQIKSLAVGTSHSVGLLEDGTVVACGNNNEGQCEVSSWKNVVQIAAAGEHTVALTKDGKILFAGDEYVYDFSKWKDVVSIATGLFHVVGLKSDGTVFHTGHISAGQDIVCKWWDIQAIFAGYYTSVGVNSDGCVFIANDKHSRTNLDSSSWNIYYGHMPRNDENSPFEAARKETVSALNKILKMGILFSPALHKLVLDSEDVIKLEDIRQLSMQTWHYRETILQMKPLADILLRYNASFVEFYDNYFSLDKEKNMFRVLNEAYCACVDFLTITKQLLVETRSL